VSQPQQFNDANRIWLVAGTGVYHVLQEAKLARDGSAWRVLALCDPDPFPAKSGGVVVCSVNDHRLNRRKRWVRCRQALKALINA
jgi:hypothetical protein